MTRREISKLFEDRKIRTVWDDKEEKWYFSIVDVVAVLTDSADPKQYIKRMKSRDEGLKANWGTICTLVPLVSEDGKKHKEMTADTTGIFRVIQSIPSHKAEPIKQWIAHVAAERIDQMQDPELSIQQAMMDYKRLGYSDNWINQRLKSIEIRKDLTDQWKLHNVEEGIQYATLTDIIYQHWSGKTAKEYKEFKGLKKENLRDNMTYVKQRRHTKQRTRKIIRRLLDLLGKILAELRRLDRENPCAGLFSDKQLYVLTIQTTSQITTKLPHNADEGDL